MEPSQLSPSVTNSKLRVTRAASKRQNELLTGAGDEVREKRKRDWDVAVSGPRKRQCYVTHIIHVLPRVPIVLLTYTGSGEGGRAAGFNFRGLF